MPGRPRAPTAQDRGAAKVLVIAPGFGFLANPQQLRCVEAAGFAVAKCFVPSPEDAGFDMATSIQDVLRACEEEQADVLLCASKGGAYMVELWARMEAGSFPKTPCLLINAHPAAKSLPKDTKVIIVQGSEEEIWHRPRGYAGAAASVEDGSLEALIRTGSPKVRACGPRAAGHLPVRGACLG